MGYFSAFPRLVPRVEAVKRAGRGAFDLYAKLRGPYHSYHCVPPPFVLLFRSAAFGPFLFSSLVLSVIPARMISHGLASKASEDHTLTLCCICNCSSPCLAKRMLRQSRLGPGYFCLFILMTKGSTGLSLIYYHRALLEVEAHTCKAVSRDLAR